MLWKAPVRNYVNVWYNKGNVHSIVLKCVVLLSHEHLVFALWDCEQFTFTLWDW
jgi:hypothetical protein